VSGTESRVIAVRRSSSSLRGADEVALNDVHRYYDPSTGQFLSVDPLVATTGQPFGYAGNDPVNASDPLGLSYVGYCSPTDCPTEHGGDAIINDAGTNNPVNNQTPCAGTLGYSAIVISEVGSSGNSSNSSSGSPLIYIKDTGEFTGGLIIIIGADAMATAVIVADAAGLPEDAPLLPAETGLFGGVLSAANGLGLYLIYKSLGFSPPGSPAPIKMAPGPIGSSPAEPRV
jgi:hypothetical protein